MVACGPSLSRVARVAAIVAPATGFVPSNKSPARTTVSPTLYSGALTAIAAPSDEAGKYATFRADSALTEVESALT